MSAFPQTINGVPVDVPGMPGEIGSEGDDLSSVDPGAETDAPPPGTPGAPPGPEGPADEDRDDPNEGGPEDDPEGKLPPFGSMLRTASGHTLPYAEYLNHLAVRFSDDPKTSARIIRESRIA
jgi:hypothetical protein